MKGIDAYNNRYESMARGRIAKTDEKYMLKGFYNYIITSKSYSTAYLYLSYVISFIKNVDDIAKIDFDDYNAFLASLKNESQTAQINAYHALQKYSKYLKAKGITKDYMEYVDRPKFFETAETKDKRENGYLTKTEAKRVADMALTQTRYNKKECEEWRYRDYVIITIFLTTGIRCSALYKLDVEDVNLREKTITVFEKGNKTRKIVIPDITVEAIEKWLTIRFNLLNGVKENALIISNKRNRLAACSIAYVIKKVSEDAGRTISPHKLRATYGTRLYNATKDLFFVQECMGHSNPKTTELYIRGQKRDVAKKAADLMGGFME